jgi:hypothetical protein
VHELGDERHEAGLGVHAGAEELHDVRVVQLLHQLQLRAELRLSYLVIAPQKVEIESKF